MLSWIPTLTPLGMRVAVGPEERGERLAGRPQLRVEDRHLERRLGHRMPVQLAQPRRDVGRVERAAGDQAGQEVMDHHVLGAVDVLRRVARLAQRDALAPALGLGAVLVAQRDPHQQDVTVGLAAEAGAERRDERHGDATQLDPLDRPRSAGGSAHGVDPITYSPARVNPTIGRPAASAAVERGAGRASPAGHGGAIGPPELDDVVRGRHELERARSDRQQDRGRRVGCRARVAGRPRRRAGGRIRRRR